jgi:hypothetical protein
MPVTLWLLSRLLTVLHSARRQHLGFRTKSLNVLRRRLSMRFVSPSENKSATFEVSWRGWARQRAFDNMSERLHHATQCGSCSLTWIAFQVTRTRRAGSADCVNFVALSVNDPSS